MRLSSILTTAVLASAFTAPLAADEVRRLSGERHAGTVQSVSANEVTIGGSVNAVTVPANEISAVIYLLEPRGLTEAREAYATGRYASVFDSLNEIKPDQIRRDEVKSEIEFYRTASAARLAILGNVDPKSATAAGMDLNKFITDHKNSHHFYEANEALGDLLSSLKNSNAFRYYDVVANAPWPEYKTRAAVLKGRAAQMHGNHQAALEHFDTALQTEGTGRTAEMQLQLARIGKATSLSDTGKVDDALKILEEVVAKAEHGDRQIHARAYNVIGACHRKKKETTEALLAYLKVDLLFNANPDAHAEALYNLSQLWIEDRHPERARAATDTLKQRYPTSRWNKS